MKDKKVIVVGTAIAAGGLVYFLHNLKISKQNDKSFLAQAIIFYKEKKYDLAIECLKAVKKKNLECIQLLYQCHLACNNKLDALVYCSQLYTARKVSSFIPEHFDLCNSLELFKLAFKDLFLLNLLNGNDLYKQKITDYLKNISKLFSYDHKYGTNNCTLIFRELFDTLFFLEEINDPIIVFIKSCDYVNLRNAITNSSEEIHKLIYAIMLYADGKLAEAIELIKNSQYKYSILFRLFFSLKLRNQQKIVKEAREALLNITLNDLKEEIINSNSSASKTNILSLKDEEKKLIDNFETEDDPTIQFYLAKIFEILENKQKMFECINKSLKKKNCAPTLCFKIVVLIRQNKSTEAKQIIKKAIDSFPEHIGLFCIAIEYLIHLGEVREAFEYYQKIENFKEEDPRPYLLKYILEETVGNSNPDLLNKGIKVDPEYYKLYIYQGNATMGSEHSYKAYRQALRCASNFDEVYTVHQLLLVVETQNEIIKEYPDLFDNKND